MSKKAILIIFSFLILFFAFSTKAQAGCDYDCSVGSHGYWAACHCGGFNCCSDCQVYVCSVWLSEKIDSCTYCQNDISLNCGGSCSGGCFTEETEVKTFEGGREIKDLKAGEQVQSLDPETDEKSTSLIEEVHEVTRSAYYKLKLQDGKEIEVTGEHPLYAIQKEKIPLTFWEYLKTESLVKRGLDSLLR